MTTPTSATPPMTAETNKPVIRFFFRTMEGHRVYLKADSLRRDPISTTLLLAEGEDGHAYTFYDNRLECEAC